MKRNGLVFDLKTNNYVMTERTRKVINNDGTVELVKEVAPKFFRMKVVGEMSDGSKVWQDNESDDDTQYLLITRRGLSEFHPL